MVLNSHSGSEKSHTSLHAAVPNSATTSPYISTALETASAWSSKLHVLFQRITQNMSGKRPEPPSPQSVSNTITSPRESMQKTTSSPARSAPSVLGDSPVKARPAVIEEYRLDYVNEQRKAIIGQLGATVPWGTLDYCTSIVPPLRPEFDIDRITNFLITKNHLKKRRDSYIWTELETKLNATDNVVYNKPLENIYNAIIDAALRTSGIKATQTLGLVTNENHAPWSARKSEIKPDGFLVLRDSDVAKTNSTLWYNRAACFAFKTNKHRNDKYENISQAIHSMQHVLAIDPCRRFTYGFTVERTRIKLWIATRAMVISCESFDFQTQYKELIRLFLSLSFASKEELGWDMTVKPEPEGNSRNYDFEIAGEHYLTSEKDMIIGDKATDIVGSGTRIWHAWKGSKESRDEVVIKDYWPSEDRETEDALHRMILDDIKDVEKRQFFIEHTLNPIAAESVRACGKEDHTEKTILRGNSPDLSTLYKFPVPASKGAYKVKTGNLPGMEASLKTEGRRLVRELGENERTRYYHRKHHRIVYKEVATPFYKIRNTKEMYIVIVDVLKTLLILHEAGWVHRDISAGNLYLYEDPVSKVKRGLIGDFEYAKKVGSGGQHDVRTGTPNFMAVEIARQGRLYGGPSESKAFEDLLPLAGVEDALKNSSKDTKDGIIYNYIHDLESLWWVIVWISFLYEKSPPSRDKESQDRAEQRKHYYKLFPGDMSVNERMNFLTSANTFLKVVNHIPSDFKNQALLISSFRKAMLHFYKDAEAITPESEPIHIPNMNRIHDVVLFQIPKLQFEEMEVIPVLDKEDKEESNSDECKVRGSKRLAEDDPLPGSSMKKSRFG